MAHRRRERLSRLGYRPDAEAGSVGRVVLDRASRQPCGRDCVRRQGAAHPAAGCWTPRPPAPGRQPGRRHVRAAGGPCHGPRGRPLAGGQGHPPSWPPDRDQRFPGRRWLAAADGHSRSPPRAGRGTGDRPDGTLHPGHRRGHVRGPGDRPAAAGRHLEPKTSPAIRARRGRTKRAHIARPEASARGRVPHHDGPALRSAAH